MTDTYLTSLKSTSHRTSRSHLNNDILKSPNNQQQQHLDTIRSVADEQSQRQESPSKPTASMFKLIKNTNREMSENRQDSDENVQDEPEFARNSAQQYNGGESNNNNNNYDQVDDFRSSNERQQTLILRDKINENKTSHSSTDLLANENNSNNKKEITSFKQSSDYESEILSNEEIDTVDLTDSNGNQNLENRFNGLHYTSPIKCVNSSTLNGNNSYYTPGKINNLNRSRDSTDSVASRQKFIKSPTPQPTLTRRSSILESTTIASTNTTAAVAAIITNGFASPASNSSPVPSYVRSSKACPTKANQGFVQILLNVLFSTNYALILALIAILLAIFLFGGNTFNKKLKPEISIQDQENIALQKEIQKAQSKNLVDYLSELKQKYPNQTNSFWANIESSFRHSIIRQKDPSILLVVNDKRSKSLAEKITVDILTHLVQVFDSNSKAKNVNDLIIDAKKDQVLHEMIKENSHDKSKLYIDTRLTSLFGSGKKMALVNNIEMLPAQTMLLFYTYGDDLHNAKFPGIMILMSLNIDYELESGQRARFLKSSSVLTKFSEDYLFNLWSKSINDDQLRPLFTRIANNVIFVNN